MDLDFHYYGTFIAARLAEYSHNEAVTIAHAAQYVDDSAWGDPLGIYTSRLIKKGEYGIDFQPIPTCQVMPNVVTSAIEEKRRIWAPFHFLPGNYESQALPDPEAKKRMIAYNGPRESWSGFSRWKYDSRAEWEFKLTCLPQSPLVTKMVNQIIENFKFAPFEFHLTGLRMHVLADTGAHMYYAGTPAWHVNDVYDGVSDMTVSPPQEIPWGGTSGEWCTPRSLYADGWPYLGHGRMGHVPDYPWAKYMYKPMWSSQPFLKDNSKEYLRTFIEMVTALKCIRESRPFNVLKPDPIKDEDLQTIKRILNTLPKQKWGQWYDTAVALRCEVWKSAIKNEFGGIMQLPPDYNADLWLNDFKGRSKSMPEMDYYNFNLAAIEHYRLVEKYLLKDGIPLVNPPQSVSAEDGWPLPDKEDLLNIMN